MNDGLISVRVSSKHSEADDICVLELVAADGGPLPPFDAGAHVDLHLPNGLVRQYSLCNDPAENQRYVIGVLREPQSRGGSAAVHASIAEGDLLAISRPRNLFPLGPVEAGSLLLAGGIGITPILGMAEHLAAVGADFELHYCGRTRSRMAFLDRIAASRYAGRTRLHVDDEGETGLDFDRLLRHCAPGTHIYVCGPGGFIDMVTGLASKAGWPAAQIHLERFSAQAAPAGDDGAFDLKIASSGQVIRVNADETAAAALVRHGIAIETSCEQGICGTCATRVLEGEPEHRDLCLSDEEHEREGMFTPCCSRSRSALLVLDL
jgi:vanillate O-demethylase ferredoxin subunit